MRSRPAICLLLRADRDRYDRACVRWIERFAGEVDGATLADVYQLAAGLGRLADRRSAARDVERVEAVLRRHRLDRAADRLIG